MRVATCGHWEARLQEAAMVECAGRVLTSFGLLKEIGFYVGIVWLQSRVKFAASSVKCRKLPPWKKSQSSRRVE